LQRKYGVVTGLETTRASAVDPDFFRVNQAAGVAAINVTLASPEARKGDSTEGWTFERTIESIDEWHEAIVRHGDETNALMPVLDVDDILRAKQEGRVGIIFGTQGAGYWIDREFLLLRTAHRLGVRIIGISYQRRTIYMDGAGEKSNAGISTVGEALVDELNRLGIVIDLSHSAERSALEIIERSSQPIIFSHNNPRTLSPVPENITDREIDAVAANGGVIGISCFSPDCMPDYRNPEHPDVDDYVRHLDYVVERIGPDHVGLGLDYAYKRRQEDLDLHNVQYGDILPEQRVETVQVQGLTYAPEIVNVTSRLLRLGYPEDAIAKILSGNFLRVFRTVWGS
jgi:membrane dipeptidase